MSLPVRTLSLKTLLAALTVMAAFPPVLMGLFFMSSLWEKGQELSSRTLAETVDALAVAVDRELNGFTRELKMLGDLEGFKPAPRAEMRAQALQMVERGEGFGRILMSERSGHTVFDTSAAAGSLLPVRLASRVDEVFRTGQAVISDVQPDPVSNLPAVLIAVPAPRDGPVQTVIEAEIDPRQLSRVIAKGLIESSAAVVIDRSLHIVARSVDIEDRFAELIKSDLGLILQRQPEQGVTRLERPGGTILVAWRRIPLGWTVAASELTVLREAPLRESFVRLLVTGTVLLALTLSIVLIFGQQITRSIDAVAADAQSLAHGLVPTSRTSKIAEIGVMFDSIVRAGEQLMESRRARERMNAALHASEQRLSLAIDATEAGTLDWNLLNDDRDASPRARALFGLPPEGPVVAGRISAAVHSDDQARFLAALMHARAGRDEGRIRIECRVVDASGTWHWLECRGQTQFTPTGSGTDEGAIATRIVLVVVDQTERESHVQALRDADRRKDEFLAMLAHELRNPLAPLRTAVSLLQRTVPAESIAGQAVSMSARQVSHMTRLVNDLLDVSRITQGKIELRLEPTPISDVIHDALEAIGPMIQQRGQVLHVEQPEPSPVVTIDRVRIMQVLENLLSNACKYTDAGGSIELRVIHDERTVTLRVSDTGIGISAEQLPHVFDLFTQGNVSIDRAQGGLGIGLALVRNLVELHGGTVSAHSAGPGKGARFDVCLLRVPRLTADTAASPETHTGGLDRSGTVSPADDTGKPGNTI